MGGFEEESATVTKTPDGRRNHDLRAGMAMSRGLGSKCALDQQCRLDPADVFMSSKQGGAGLGAMTLGALGVVYGDIGTSPLYTLHEIFVPVAGVGVPRDPPPR